MERIIVAVDGGPASRAAVNWAAHRAATTGAELEIVCVEDTEWLPIGAPTETYTVAYVRALESALVRAREVSPHLSAMTTLLHGKPAEELARASTRADLLVVGANHAGTFAGASYGTLPLKLAAHSHCPIVVVPADWSQRSGHIVVGSVPDGTQRPALEFAAREAGRTGHDLTVVHAWAVPVAISIGDFMSPNSHDGLQQAHSALVNATANELRSRYPGITVHTHTALATPASALLDAARDAELLVVGSHGRGPLRGLLMGSVSHALLVHATCPVVVVPSPARDRAHSIPEFLDEEP